ncbi:MAG: hypothetical protein U5K69_13640 [Balneolaceae bacterium]|nr:hypothetical protein [Balneolaceae bacterium]
MEEDHSNLFSGDLNDLSGRYTGPTRGSINDVTVEAANGNLIVRRTGSKAKGDTLQYVSGLTWKRGDDRLEFVRMGDEIVELRVDVIFGHDVLRRVR